MPNNSNDFFKTGSISASGRRFISDAPKDFHYTSFETKNLLRAYAPESDTPLLYKKAALVELEPHLVFNKDKITLSFNIYSGQGHSYVLKDIAELIKAIDENSTVSYGKHLEFTHDLSAFSDASKKIIRFLKDYFRHKQNGFTYSYAKGHSKQIELEGHEIDEFFSSVSGVYYVNNDFRAKYSEERYLEIVPVFPPIDLHIDKTPGGITFEASSFTMFEGYSYLYFERRRKLHMIPRVDAEPVIPFLRFLSARRTENELFISEKDLPVFSTGLLPVIEEYFNVGSDGFEASMYTPDIPKFRLYIDMPDDFTVTCDLQALYHEGKNTEEAYHVFEEASAFDANDARDKEQLPVIRRNLFAENQAAKAISPHFDKLDAEKGLLILGGESAESDRIYTFITDDIPSLDRIGEVYLSDNIKAVHIVKSPKISLGVSVVSDLLQLSIVPEDLTNDELDEILTRYDRKKKYFRLKSGDIVDLSGNEMELLYTLRDGLSLTSKDILEGHAAVPKFRALFLDDLSGQSKDFLGPHLSRSREFKALVDSFNEDEKAIPLPESLSEVLRDYQKTGFQWFARLRKNGFGAVLADDMGLGKTLQVLTLLLSIKEKNIKEGKKNKCSLIVCPASLVYNWQHEIQKFTPQLHCELAVGIKPDRERVTSEINEEGTDVIITSYDLLRRDIELYKYLSFECEIIDEAQFIKNPSTQGAKAVKSISASFKIALTGTPIENRLSELWSIFDYCMPGYLFSYKKFHDVLEGPAVSEKDESAMERLRKMIAPFVMRRLKKDVLKDLPDKLEENIYAPMTKEQAELYKARLQHIKMMVELKSDEDFKKDRIVILSELTRLRQICCDPGLVYDGYQGGSAKADLCLEMIKSAAESGHKMLVFSQFTSMLERLTALLKKEGISYYLLTGATKKEDRIKMVDTFQEDETPVFCISLKAGGTGLNLTAADIVIHYDHWWNRAVENQATDRAHRIGQKNVVTVYRLIMQDTIEERIILLQNKKKELAEQLLSSDSLSTPSLSRKDLLELLG
ncbi:DEAD/DEAH box helicase [Butyrivibrio sp. AE3009]|uniref:DEAD/DEAH box helicase n=1 Tax=Butyrivibrio sp. AE3009 TaxID=1280666 RepID=UPI0003B4C60D|nr:SNF2-related protein [Butyrivibrio sp. AE3009]